MKSPNVNILHKKRREEALGLFFFGRKYLFHDQPIRYFILSSSTISHMPFFMQHAGGVLVSRSETQLSWGSLIDSVSFKKSENSRS